VRLFRSASFSAAALTTFVLGACLFGAMIIMPLYFQLVRGEDAVTTGLLLIPQGIGAAMAMPLAGRFSDRVGGGRVALAGLAVTLVTTLPFVALQADTSYLLISAAMIGRGLGIGLTMMPAMTAAYARLRPEDIAHATPQLNVLQRVGGSIGTALLTVVLQHGLTAGAQTPAAAAHAFGNTYLWVLALTAVAAIPAFVLARSESAEREQALPAGVVAEAAA
jgi:MFS family permease